uniref:Uncharacterized protein n=1 Tax=Panagrolaimus sp. PS1159 TaxID=55785 RepID=A0AC35EVY4_9BILA
MKGQSASKFAPISQLFQHLKGSKKDKSRRHTIYVAPQNDVIIEPLKTVENLKVEEDGKKVEEKEECKNSLKPRSLSHEPLSSKDNLKSKEYVSKIFWLL